MASALTYAAEVIEILGGLVVLSDACARVRKRIQEHRRDAYRPRHVRPRRLPGRAGRHELRAPRA
ncbi:MAG: hypothetical protein ACRDOB_13930 [Streptosporangiaceae bacterium]